MVRKTKLSLSMLGIHTVLLLFAALCIIPFIAVLSISFSSEMDIAKQGYSLLPRNFSTTAYEFILKNPITILRSYGVTIGVCVVGTGISLLLTSLCAYPLSRRDFRFRGPISFYVFFTMLFSGGLVPSYIWVTNSLHLGDSFWVLFLPTAVSAWYLLLMRTFFQSIPFEIIESATIDGASEWRIYRSMILPLSKPALATVGLFTVLGYWNDWFYGLLYIENQNLVTLQYMLYRIMGNIQELQRAIAAGMGNASLTANLPSE